MSVREYFHSRRETIVRLWTEAVYTLYPFETTGFLRTRQDPFANPVADMTREAGSVIYDAVAGADIKIEDIKNALDRFVKWRAAQQEAPSRGIGVLLLMKPILREEVLPGLAGQGNIKDYLDAESRLDTLALLAFDMYLAAREKLAQARVKEIRLRYAQLERWAQGRLTGSCAKEAKQAENPEREESGNRPLHPQPLSAPPDDDDAGKKRDRKERGEECSHHCCWSSS